MQIKEIIAISGVPGLHRLNKTRPNGMVATELQSGKSRFYSVRKHQFTPLESVAIYTEDDAVELKDLFQRMKEKAGELPFPDSGAGTSEWFSYFEQILPEYDKDRVKVSDVKKVVKWFNILEQNEMLEEEEE